MNKHYFKMLLGHKNDSHATVVIICIISKSDSINDDIIKRLFARCIKYCKKHPECAFEYVEQFVTESEC